MEDPDIHLSISRRFLAVAVIIILVSISLSYIRNHAWQTSEDLWLDVCEKAYARRIIDPTTNTEVPRVKRGRMYNNIGLCLFYRGFEILAIRDKIGNFLAQKEGSGTEERIDLVRLQKEENRLELALISHIPSEFIEVCKKSWFMSREKPWDPLLPAELCYRKALYHRPTYPTACLNMGLLHKRRADRLTPDSEEWGRELEMAETFYAAAHTFYEAYEKALWYHAIVTFKRKDYAKTLRLITLAQDLNDPSVGVSGKWHQYELGAKSGLLSKDYATAERFISRYIALKPPAHRGGPILANLADILAEQSQLEASLTLLREAIGAVPEQEAFLRGRLTTRLAYAGRFDEAYREAALMAKRFPDSHTALTDAGRFALKLGRYDEGGVWLNKAIRLVPDSRLAALLLQATIYNMTISFAQKMHLPWLPLPEILQEKME